MIKKSLLSLFLISVSVLNALPESEKVKFNAIVKDYEERIQKDPTNIKLILAVAEVYYSLQEYSKAINYYSLALELDPNNAKIKTSLALSFLNNDDRRRSLILFEEVLKNDPNNIDALSGLGRLYALNFQFSQAEKNFQAVLKKDPNHFATRFYLAELYLAEDRYQEAQKILQELVKDDPNASWVRQALKNAELGPALDQVKALEDAENYSAALGILLDLHKKDPENEELYSKLANLYTKMKRYSEAIELLNKGIALFPGNTTLPLTLGFTYLAKNDLTSAEYIFEQALEQGISQSYAKAGLGQIAYLRGNKRESENYYQSSLILNPTNILTLSYMADLQFKEKHYSQAIEIYEKILAINPNETFAKQRIQLALMGPYLDKIENESNITHIEKLYDELLRKFPKNTDAYINFSKFYRSQNRFDQAINVAEHGLIINPGSIPLTLELALDYQLDHEYAKALSLYNTVLATQKQNVNALSGLGRNFALTGDEDTSEKYYLWALKIDPSDQTALAYLIDLKMKQKKYIEAKNLAQRALVEIPKAKWVKETLVRAEYGPLFDKIEALEKEGRLNEALVVLETLQQKAPESEEVYLDLGLILTKLKRYQNAIQAYNRGLEENPKSSQLLVNLGLIYLKMNDTAQSRFYINQALRNDPLNADALAALGKIAYNEGKKADAEKLYAEALSINPRNMLALSYLASFYLSEREFDKASEIFRKIMKIDPQALWAHYGLKEAEVQPILEKGEKSGISASVSIYQQLIDEYPNQPEAYILLAQASIKMKRPQDAIAVLKKGLQILPQSTELKNALGFAYFAQGNLDLGRKIFMDVLQSDPENAESMSGLGRYEELSGDKKEAITWYKKALASNPLNFTAGTLLAKVLYDMGRYEESETLYLEMAKLQPKARWLKAAALDAKHGRLLFEIEKQEKEKNYAEAGVLLQQLLREEPQFGDYYLRAALFYHQEKAYQKSIDIYLRGIKVDPDYAELYAGLGLVYLSIKEPGEAKQAFEHTLKLDPRNADALAGLGVVAMIEGDYSDAEDLIQTALYIDPERTAALSALGDLMMKEKRYREAQAAYQRLLELENEKWVRLALDDAIYGNELDQIQVLIEEKNYSAAADGYRQLLSRSPNNAKFYYGLGQMLMRLKEYGQSISVNLEGLAKNPDDEELRVALGYAYFFSDHHEEARGALMTALQLDEKNPEALAGLGRVNALEEDASEAENLYVKALYIDPKNLSALTFYSNLLMKQKRYDEAQAIFARVLEILPDAEWVKWAWQDAVDGPITDVANRLANQEEFELAAGLYRQLINSSPDDPSRYLALGQMYVDLQCYCRGLEVFYRGLEIDPEAPYLWRAIALTYIQLEYYCQAQCIYAYLLHGDPDDAESWAGLGRIQALNGTYTAAENYYDYALTLSPKNLTALSFYGDLKQDERLFFSSLWAWKWIYQLAQAERCEYGDPIPKWVRRGYNNALNLTRPVLTLGGWYHEEDQWDPLKHRWSAEYIVYGARALINYPVCDCFSVQGSLIDQVYTLKDLLTHKRLYSFDVQRLHVGAEIVFNPCFYAFGRIGFSRYSPYHRSTFICQTHTLTEPSLTFVYHTPIQKATLGVLTDSDLVARNFNTNHAKLVGYNIIAGTYERKIMRRGWAGIEANATWYRDYVNNKSQRVLGWFQWRPPCYSENILFRYFAKYQTFSKNIPDYYTYKPQIVNQLQVTLEKNWRIPCSDRFYTSLSYGHGWQNTRTRFPNIIVINPAVVNPPFVWDNRQFDIVFGSIIYKYNCLQMTLAGDYYRDSEKYTIGTIGLDVSWRF